MLRKDLGFNNINYTFIFIKLYIYHKSTHSLVAEWSVAIALTRVQIPVRAFLLHNNILFKYFYNI